jgi:hypothetical protein
MEELLGCIVGCKTLKKWGWPDTAMKERLFGEINNVAERRSAWGMDRVNVCLFRGQ